MLEYFRIFTSQLTAIKTTFAVLSALCTFYMHCADIQQFKQCRHHLHASTLSLHASALSLHASALSIHTTKRTKCLLHRQHHFTVTADNHARYGRPNFRLLLLKSRPPYTTANKRYHRNYNTALTSSVLRANGNYTPQSGKWCNADSSVDKVHTRLHYQKRWFSSHYIKKCRVQTNLHYSPIGQLRHIMMHGSRYYFIRFFCPLSCK